MLQSTKSSEEIEAMRQGGQILATVLQYLRQKSTVGLTPKDMSALARTKLESLDGEPAFLNFYGYPDIICISVNDQVQHAIPDDRPFQKGDIVNYDFGVKYKGLITDAGITVCIGGRTTTDTARLIQGTEQALKNALKVIKDGCRVGDISAIIEKTLQAHRLGIVKELVGHGVGHALHEEPEIPNYGRAGTGPILKAGMTVAIEPITTLGDARIFETGDGWTLKTKDGSWSAQFEHTVLVTQTGCEVLTTV